MGYAQQATLPHEHATITIANIYPPKAANKPTTIKDIEGCLFSVWQKDLNASTFRVGEAYEIEFTAKDVNGVTYRDIKQARVATPPSPPPPQFTAQYRQPPARSLSSAATAQPEAKPNGNGQQTYYRPTSPRDAERMFVCSTLNAFIQTGRVDCHAPMLVDCINQLRAAWKQTFGTDPD